MLRQAPYLLRRGYGLTFRIAVPAELRPIIGAREITKSLSTGNKEQAGPLALEFAACAKRLFCELRAEMSSDSKEEGQVPDQGRMLKLLQQAQRKMEIAVIEDQHSDELFEQRREHLREIQFATLTTEVETLRSVLAGSQTHPAPTPSPALEIALAVSPSSPMPTLKMVVSKFLEDYTKKRKPQMLKKHKPVLTMFLELVGDKPISEIRQADINDFFELLGRLPPRWADVCRQKKLTIRQVADLDHDKMIGPKTFDQTYRSSVRNFLIAAKKDWQDQGFPLGLTTEGIDYLGEREEGEYKQRSFEPAELKRLFEGNEMRAFAADATQAHCYWLPTLGLFTGARVNELCQLNPQTDILEDPETENWYFWITDKTESDDRITKSVKGGEPRKVPIHKELIGLGFIEYVKRVQKSGAKLLFPEWTPIRRRASGEAEKWFSQLLRDTSLRDETPKKCLLGMHAFRHTLLTHGAMRKPPLSLFCITGHAQGDTPIDATGAGRGYLTLSLLDPIGDRATLLDQLDYGLNFFKPMALVPPRCH